MHHHLIIMSPYHYVKLKHYNFDSSSHHPNLTPPEPRPAKGIIILSSCHIIMSNWNILRARHIIPTLLHLNPGRPKASSSYHLTVSWCHHNAMSSCWNIIIFIPANLTPPSSQLDLIASPPKLFRAWLWVSMITVITAIKMIRMTPLCAPPIHFTQDHTCVSPSLIKAMGVCDKQSSHSNWMLR